MSQKRYDAANAEQISRYKKQWYAENPEKARAAHFRRRNYGITLEQFDALNKSQNGLCAICGQPQTGKKKYLCVDHCHKTGKVRGLLCSACNCLLGYAKDNRETLGLAIGYLNYHNKK